jgi:hypothetical protein
MSKMVSWVRYGIPAVFVLAGLLCLLFAPGNLAVEGWALFTGAGLSVLLLNVLYRMGAQGDTERDREEEARAHFAEHGSWPGEEGQSGSRRWRLPEGIATPESEAVERARRDEGRGEA